MVAILDLFRWVSTSVVLGYHLRINIIVPEQAIPAGQETMWQHVFYWITDCGPPAIVWFFVTSGYLVGGSVITDIRLGTFNIYRYLINRAARIYTVLIPALFVGYMLDQSRILRHGLSSAGAEMASSYDIHTVVANLLCLQTVLASTLGSNKPLWSLAYEGWYYILFPFMLAPFWARRRFGGVSGIVFCFALCAVLMGNPPILGGFSLFLFGVAARLAPTPIIRSQAIAWLCAMVVIFTYPWIFAHIGNGAKVVSGLTLANAILTARFAANQASLPGAALYAGLAGFSYTLYLTHAPALHFVLTSISGQLEPALDLPPTGWTPVIWGVSLFAVLVFYGFLFRSL